MRGACVRARERPEIETETETKMVGIQKYDREREPRIDKSVPERERDTVYHYL